MSMLVNPATIAAANPQGNAAAQSARKANAEAYAAALRDPVAPQAAKAASQPVATAFAREAPFGAERPRYQRPGSVLDIRV